MKYYILQLHLDQIKPPSSHNIMCALYNFKYMLVIRTDNLPPVPGEGEGGEGGQRDQQAQHQQEILQTLISSECCEHTADY